MLLWITDIHLNFLKQPGAAKIFAQCLMDENPGADGLVITGDISDSHRVENHLVELSEGFTKPIYITLGNHDYYGSSFDEVDDLIHKLVAQIPHLHWLNEGWHRYHDAVLVGVGGWYDAYYGNTNTREHLNDFYEIKDLMPGIHYHDLLLQLVRDRAGQQADCLAGMMKEACAVDTDTVIVCTHAAPYGEAAWYRGEISERDMMPWFSSASTGAVLDIYADKYPEKTFIVLCGHSHDPGIYQRKDNMTVYTGRARYGIPDLAGAIDTERKMLWAYGSSSQKVELKYRP